MYKKTARIASQKDFANFRNNRVETKKQGLRLVKVQGNWIVINLNVSPTEAFWKAWRTKKAELQAKGYHIARVYNMWIVY